MITQAMQQFHPQSFCLLEAGFASLTNQQVKTVRTESVRLQCTLCEAILKLDLISQDQLLQAATQHNDWSLVNLNSLTIDHQALTAIGAQVATHYHIVPIALEDQTLTIAICDPFATHLPQELNLVLENSYKLNFVLAPYDAISAAIRKCYGVGAATVEQLVATKGVSKTASTTDELIEQSSSQDASVIKLVNQILADAIDAKATDIHFEPHDETLRVRYRVDGVLRDSGIPNTVRHFCDGIASRVKIISGLDIAEKRLPQDGRAQVNLSGQLYDLRVSVLPSRYGEAINIRILPRASLMLDLPALGFPDNMVETINQLIHKPHGIFLVTGPTGSGKTTTLYTAMNLLNRIDRKIITIEDPVEYNMAGLIQMQVMPEIDFTFARALRSVLRHDPDIILIGEIRDLETAETAIRTALTGHLVFSTLHTNSAASALTRLLDMGIEPYLAASSIEAILAQRLVRLICPHCKKIDEPANDIATVIKSLTHLKTLPTVYHGSGCNSCRFTGYQGRTVVSELMIMTNALRQLTIHRRHVNEFRDQAQQENMQSLFDDGLTKAHQGLTTYDEILRITNGAIVTD